ncbi:MAG: hypothetical protein ABGZ53_22765 [Fuerstiella sp.]
MDKSALSEREICSKLITPALQQAGWDLQTQIREERPLTDGRVEVRGSRNRTKRPIGLRSTHLLSQVTRLESTLTRRESTRTQLLPESSENRVLAGNSNIRKS